jgi:hypothetical protein
VTTSRAVPSPDLAARDVYRELLARSGGPGAGEYAEYDRDPVRPEVVAAKLIALYSPPDPPSTGRRREGAVDWGDVSSALPQFVGHYQPRVPGELGYYDVRTGDVLRRQVGLARHYGIHAFCFRWGPAEGAAFPTPLERYLSDQTVDFAFCVWWSGGRPSVEAGEALRDRRYLRIAAKPLVIVDPAPTPSETETMLGQWRADARQSGVGEVFLALTLRGGEDPSLLGADAGIEPPPTALPEDMATSRGVAVANPRYRGRIFDYRVASDHARALPPSAFPLIRSVVPSWDSEPERPGNGWVLRNATPDRYRRWLAAAIAYAREHPIGSESFVFVNGWNNWAEGAYLEPDRRYGHKFLAATREALTASCAGSPRPTLSPDRRVAVVVHAYHSDLLPDILRLLAAWRQPYELHVTGPPERADAIRGHIARAGIAGELHVFENRGRDILPFLLVARSLASSGERVVLKLHTKRSLHRGDGERWRRDLVDKLLEPANAARIADAMFEDGRIGMVAPEGHVLSLTSFWKSNRFRVEQLAYRMGLPFTTPEQLTFVGGSMFWARTAALAPLLDLDLEPDDFEPEAGQVDGTLAHAIERGFALSLRRAGLRLTDSSDPGTEVAAGRTRYLHAVGEEEAPSGLPLDFDPAAYLRANPDVEASGLDPGQHYLKWGWSEGRRW